MKAWFLSLTQRERKMVQLAGAVIIVFMLYLVIIEPISSTYDKNKKNVAAALDTIEWMRTAAKEVRELGGVNAAENRPQGKQFLLSMIDRSARKHGLASVMKRVQPEGDSGIRVWFEGAAFDTLVKWLASIESEQGLLVNEINIEKTESTGLVNVRVFLDS